MSRFFPTAAAPVSVQGQRELWATWAIARGANYEEALHRQEYDFDVFLFFLILIIIIDFKNNDFNITRVAIMRGTRDIT